MAGGRPPLPVWIAHSEITPAPHGTSSDTVIYRVVGKPDDKPSSSKHVITDDCAGSARFRPVKRPSIQVRSREIVLVTWMCKSPTAEVTRSHGAVRVFLTVRFPHAC
jgi:hypothetical protein